MAAALNMAVPALIAMTVPTIFLISVTVVLVLTRGSKW